jgi:hypothetical protein
LELSYSVNVDEIALFLNLCAADTQGYIAFKVDGGQRLCPIWVVEYLAAPKPKQQWIANNGYEHYSCN